MIDALAIGLAVEIDPTVVQAVRAGAGRHEQPLTMKLPNTTAGIEIQPSGRLRPVRLCDAATGEEMDQLLSEDLKRQLQLLTAKSRDRAAELLAPMITPGAYPSRSEFQSVFRWSALIEGFSYALGTGLLTRLDHLREPARVEVYDDLYSSKAVQRYYEISHIMAHLTLMSSDATAMPAMARAIAYREEWTPSLGFTRERTVWLAAAGAKSAAAFGPAMIELYVHALGAARHAIRIFDALFGLAAIALRHEDAQERVLRAVVSHAGTSAGQRVDDAAAAALAYRSAIDTLKCNPRNRQITAALARVGWKGDDEGDGLASPEAFRLDPMEVGPDGKMLGFSVLPSMLSASPGQHYPRSKSRVFRLKLSEKELSRIMRRAWPSS
ncbi:hypothetical protein [Bradyrhizobium elkanii]|uniref:hypothetical protein n=1 Tax=Bradyrhizobium elkanii TaxID=29448 RepID=UPI0020A20607|nr:hypothetical protein [Bradyrhizobium elkanii]MCP1968496.1 hypothetical protein [Bradyrhizobium elkanii]MCS4110003.1 hypothetical protein [Bradyrhizobium elkanii]